MAPTGYHCRRLKTTKRRRVPRRLVPLGSVLKQLAGKDIPLLPGACKECTRLWLSFTERSIYKFWCCYSHSVECCQVAALPMSS